MNAPGRTPDPDSSIDHLPATAFSRRGFLLGAAGAAAVPGWLLAHVSSSAPFGTPAAAPLRRAVPAAFRAAAPPASYAQSPPLAKFVQPLRGVFPLDPGGIPVAVPDGTRSWAGGRVRARHYTIDLAQYTDRLHPDQPATTLWGYHATTNLGGAVPQRHLGGVIVAERGVPVQLTFRNRLPDQHILPVDPTLMGAEGAHNRATVHLHGGTTPWFSDGGPFTWFRPKASAADPGPFYGEGVLSGSSNVYKVLDKNLAVGNGEYWWPMQHSARMLWYHDHAIGTTRLNAYAGLASAVLVRDLFERGLVLLGLPKFLEDGGRELPIVIQEKVFAPVDDPSFPGSAKTAGSLWYPSVYDTSVFGAAPGTDPGALPEPSCVPEFFGDTMLVNGVVHPKVALEPRRYRLRILNATQARFLNLQLYVEQAARPGEGLPDFAQPGPDFLVIGTEGGFLARPVVVPSGQRLDLTTVVDPDTGELVGREVDPAAPGGSLLTAPAERWDVVVDLSAYAGKSLVLYNDAPAPFPGGGPEWDGAIDGDGVVLNQRLLRIDVAPAVTGKPDPRLYVGPTTRLAASRLSGVDPAVVGSWATNTTAPLPVPSGVTVRDLTLNELFDDKGRLIQMLGANMFGPPPAGFSLPDDTMTPGLTAAMMYSDAATETPAAGTVEVWRIANLSMDVHPMHFHLVNVQLLSRQSFGEYMVDAAGMGMPMQLGPARGPDATELGWKDTVRMNPGEVTTVAMRFALPPVPFAVPPSPRTGGHEFVWHCHILEHEEHDMMRPLVVSGTNPRIR
jgi:spore coat protein A